MPTFETGRLAGLGLDPSAAPSATALGVGRLPGPARGRSPASVTTTAGTSAPARSATSSTWCGCSSRGRSIRAVGQRDMDVQRPGSNLPGIPDPGAARRAAPRRRAAGPAVEPQRRGTGRGADVRELGPAVPAPVPGRAGRLRRTWPADYATRRRRRSRSADHPAALRAVARADRPAARRGPTPPADDRELGARAQPRSAVPRARRLRHRRRAGEPGRVHGGGVEPDRRRAGGQPAHPARAARAARSPAAGTCATSPRSWPRVPAACWSSPRRCSAACWPTASRSRTGSRRQPSARAPMSAAMRRMHATRRRLVARVWAAGDEPRRAAALLERLAAGEVSGSAGRKTQPAGVGHHRRRSAGRLKRDRSRERGLGDGSACSTIAQRTPDARRQAAVQLPDFRLRRPRAGSRPSPAAASATARKASRFKGGACATTPSSSPPRPRRPQEPLRPPLDVHDLAAATLAAAPSRSTDAPARARPASRFPHGSGQLVVEQFKRGDGLPGDRRADVQAARRHVHRAVPARTST